MLAFISVAPEDHWDHMSPYIAKVIKLIEKSGLEFQLGPMGTSIEGAPDAVFKVLQEMHMAMRKDSKRISTLIKIDDQVDRPMGRMMEKVKSVEKQLHP